MYEFGSAVPVYSIALRIVLRIFFISFPERIYIFRALEINMSLDSGTHMVLLNRAVVISQPRCDATAFVRGLIKSSFLLAAITNSNVVKVDAICCAELSISG